MADEPEKFKNRQDVFEYLKAQGNKISKTKLYRDVANGKLHVQKDGSVLMKDVLYYIQHPAANLSPQTVNSPDLDEVQRRKIEAETRKSEAQALLAEQKAGILSGQLIDKDLFYGELAARALIFKSDLVNFFRAEASSMISMVAGDPKKAADLMDFCFAALEKALGHYSSEAEFNVPASITGMEDDSDDI